MCKKSQPQLTSNTARTIREKLGNLTILGRDWGRTHSLKNSKLLIRIVKYCTHVGLRTMPTLPPTAFRHNSMPKPWQKQKQLRRGVHTDEPAPSSLHDIDKK